MPDRLTVWRPEQVTCAWLTAALGKALGSGRVTDFDIEPVGTGQMADSYRLRLEVGRDTAFRSVVGKFTAADEQSRSTALSMRTSEVEVRFYQQLAAALPMRIPRCYYADVDPSTARFVCLLEDISPARQGDQVAGCTVDEAAGALDELAMLHSPHWDDPLLKELEWLNRGTEQSLSLLEAIFPVLWAGFSERYGRTMPPPVASVGDAFFPKIGDYLRMEPSATTLQHADYRVDNLLFGADLGTRVAVVDWQTVTAGAGASDVAYFLGGSIEVEDRRAHERDLLRHYHQRLCSGGVDGCTFDDLWADYRRYAFAGLVMAVGAAMMVERTDRGDEMFLAMARRAAAHAEDMDSLALLTRD